MSGETMKEIIIECESSKNALIEQKIAELFKEMEELSQQFGVEVGAVVYRSDSDTNPKVWPSEEAAKQMLIKYESWSQEEKVNALMTHEKFLEELLAKQQEELEMEEKKNAEKEMALLVNQLFEGKNIEDFNLQQLQGMQKVVEVKLEKLYEGFKGKDDACTSNEGNEGAPN